MFFLVISSLKYAMPSISNKGKTMPESPIRKLEPFAEKAKKKGIKVYHLNIGQPDIKTPDNAINAIKNIDLDIIKYTSSAGIQSLRDKLAEYYRKNEVYLDASEIIVTTGASEAIMFSIASIADDGDEIIIPEPFYANYIAFASSSNAHVVPVLSTIDEGFTLPPISNFEALITDKTKAILICNPNNPTGHLYSEQELKQLADIVIKHDLFLIVDEVYREFFYDEVKHFSVMNIPSLEKHAIMIDSVSKRFSMCGARIGNIASRNKEFLNTVMKFAQARLSPPTIGQIASEAALDAPQSYFDEVNTEYKERRDVLIDALNEIEGIKVVKPKGAFYCMARLPIDNAEKFAKWLLEYYSLDGETVMVAPASGFYATEGLGMNEIRLAYVLNKTDLKRAAFILKEAVKTYNEKVH